MCANVTNIANSSAPSTSTPLLHDDGINSLSSAQRAGQPALVGGTWMTFVVVGSLGALGNGFVAFVLFYRPEVRRKLANIYIINQSIIDCLASILLVLLTVFQYDGSSPMPPGLAGQIYCKEIVYRASDNTT